MSHKVTSHQAALRLAVSNRRIRISSVALYTRGMEGRWTLTDYRALSDCVRLASIDCTLALSEVYDKVERVRAKEFQRRDRGGPEREEV
jgi:hypothetical protein